MDETTEMTRARRSLRRWAGIRSVWVYVMGAAVGLAILSGVRLFSEQEQVFPPVIISFLVLIGLVGDGLTRRRHTEALADLELAARNVGRADACREAEVEDTAEARTVTSTGPSVG